MREPGSDYLLDFLRALFKKEVFLMTVVAGF